MKYVRRILMGLVIVLFVYSLLYNLFAEEFNWAWVSFMAFVLLVWIGMFWGRGKINDEKNL